MFQIVNYHVGKHLVDVDLLLKILNSLLEYIALLLKIL
jgi:hypothetical protein